MATQSNEAEDEVLLMLNNLQETMMNNLEEIKKAMASSFSPIVFAGAVIALIGGGIILTIDNMFLNYLALILALAIGVVLFFVRYFYFVRSTASVLEYITDGTPLKEPKTLPFFKKFIVFSSPEELYNVLIESLDQEQQESIPLLEESLETIRQNEQLDNS